MEHRNSYTIPLCIIAACLAAVCGFYAGKHAKSSIPETETAAAEPAVQETPADESTELQLLNREAVSHMSDEGNTIYVIGHKSPDSDTVCSAIAYARLLNLLGYTAEPRITMPVNNETKYILEQAGVETPEILDRRDHLLGRPQ